MSGFLRRLLAFVLGFVIAYVGPVYWAYQNVRPMTMAGKGLQTQSELDDYTLEEFAELIVRATKDPDQFTFDRLEKEYGLDIVKILDKAGIDTSNAKEEDLNALKSISILSILKGSNDLLDNIKVRALYVVLPSITGKSLDELLSPEAQVQLADYTLYELLNSDATTKETGLMTALKGLKLGSLLPSVFNATYDEDKHEYIYSVKADAPAALDLIANVSLKSIVDILDGADIAEELFEGGLRDLGTRPISDIVTTLVGKDTELGKTLDQYLKVVGDLSLADLFEKKEDGTYQLTLDNFAEKLELGYLFGYTKGDDGYWYEDEECTTRAKGLLALIADFDLADVLDADGDVLEIVKAAIGDMSILTILETVMDTDELPGLVQGLGSITVNDILKDGADGIIPNLLENVEYYVGNITLGDILEIILPESVMDFLHSNALLDAVLGFTIDDFLTNDYSFDSILDLLDKRLGYVDIGSTFGVEKDENGDWKVDFKALGVILDVKISDVIAAIRAGDLAESVRAIIGDVTLGEIYGSIFGYTKTDEDPIWHKDDKHVTDGFSAFLDVELWKIAASLDPNSGYDVVDDIKKLTAGDVIYSLLGTFDLAEGLFAYEDGEVYLAGALEETLGEFSKVILNIPIGEIIDNVGNASWLSDKAMKMLNALPTTIQYVVYGVGAAAAVTLYFVDNPLLVDLATKIFGEDKIWADLLASPLGYFYDDADARYERDGFYNGFADKFLSSKIVETINKDYDLYENFKAYLSLGNLITFAPQLEDVVNDALKAIDSEIIETEKGVALSGDLKNITDLLLNFTADRITVEDGKVKIAAEEEIRAILLGDVLGFVINKVGGDKLSAVMNDDGTWTIESDVLPELLTNVANVSVGDIIDFVEGGDVWDIVYQVLGDTRLGDVAGIFYSDWEEQQFLAKALAPRIKDVISLVLGKDGVTVESLFGTISIGDAFSFVTLPELVSGNGLVEATFSITVRDICILLDGGFTTEKLEDLFVEKYCPLTLESIFADLAKAILGDELYDKLAANAVVAETYTVTVDELYRIIKRELGISTFGLGHYGTMTLEDVFEEFARVLVGDEFYDKLMQNRFLEKTLGITVQNIYDLLKKNVDLETFLVDLYKDLTLGDIINGVIQEFFGQDTFDKLYGTDLVAATLDNITVQRVYDLVKGASPVDFLFDVYGDLTLRGIYESVCTIAGLDSEELLGKLITAKPAVEKVIDHKLKDIRDEGVAILWNDILFGDIFEGLVAAIVEKIDGFHYDSIYNNETGKYEVTGTFGKAIENVYNLSVPGIKEMLDTENGVLDFVIDTLDGIQIGTIIDFAAASLNEKTLFEKLYDNTLGGLVKLFVGRENVKDLFGDIALGDVFELLPLPEIVAENGAFKATGNITVADICDMIADPSTAEGILLGVYGELSLNDIIGGPLKAVLGDETFNKLYDTTIIAATLDNITVQLIHDLVKGEITAGEFLKAVYGELKLRDLYETVCVIADLDPDALIDKLITGDRAVNKILDHTVNSIVDDVSVLWNNILFGDVFEELIYKLLYDLDVDSEEFRYSVTYNADEDKYESDGSFAGVFEHIYNLSVPSVMEMLEKENGVLDFVHEMLDTVQIAEIADLITTDWHDTYLAVKICAPTLADILDIALGDKTIKDVYGDISLFDALKYFFSPEKRQLKFLKEVLSVTVGDIYDYATSDEGILVSLQNRFGEFQLGDIVDVIIEDWHDTVILQKLFAPTINDVIDLIKGEKTVKDLFGTISLYDGFKYAIPKDYRDMNVVKTLLSITVGDIYDYATGEKDPVQDILDRVANISLGDIADLVTTDWHGTPILDKLFAPTIGDIVDLIKGEKTVKDLFGTISFYDGLKYVLPQDVLDNVVIAEALNTTVGDIYDYATGEKDLGQDIIDRFGDYTVGDAVAQFLPDNVKANKAVAATLGLKIGDIYSMITDPSFDTAGCLLGAYGDVTPRDLVGGLLKMALGEDAYNDLNDNKLLSATLDELSVRRIYDSVTSDDYTVLDLLDDVYGQLTFGDVYESICEIAGLDAQETLDALITAKPAVEKILDHKLTEAFHGEIDNLLSGILVGDLFDGLLNTLLEGSEFNYSVTFNDVTGRYESDGDFGDTFEEVYNVDLGELFVMIRDGDEALFELIHAILDTLQISEIVDIFSTDWHGEPLYDKLFAPSIADIIDMFTGKETVKNVYGTISVGDVLAPFGLPDEINNNPFINASKVITVGDVCDLITGDLEVLDFLMSVYGDLTIGDTVGAILKLVLSDELYDKIAANDFVDRTFDIVIRELFEAIIDADIDLVDYLMNIYGTMTIRGAIGELLDEFVPANVLQDKIIDATLDITVQQIFDLATGATTVDQFLLDAYGDLKFNDILQTICTIVSMESDELLDLLPTGKPAIEKILDHSVREAVNGEFDKLFEGILIGDVIEGLMSLILTGAEGFDYSVTLNDVTGKYESDGSFGDTFEILYNINIGELAGMIMDGDSDGLLAILRDVLETLGIGEIVDIFNSDWHDKALLTKLFAPTLADILDMVTGDKTVKEVYGTVSVGDVLDLVELPEFIAENGAVKATRNITVANVCDLITGDLNAEDMLMDTYGDLTVGDILGSFLEYGVGEQAYDDLLANDFIARTFGIVVRDLYNAITDENVDLVDYLMSVYGDMTLGGALNEVLEAFVPEDILNNKAIEATLDITVQQIYDLVNGDLEATAFVKSVYGNLTIDDCIGQFLGLEEPLASNKFVKATLGIKIGDIIDVITGDMTTEDFFLGAYGDLTVGDIIGGFLKMALNDDELYEKILANDFIDRTFNDIIVREFYEAVKPEETTGGGASGAPHFFGANPFNDDTVVGKTKLAKYLLGIYGTMTLRGFCIELLDDFVPEDILNNKFVAATLDKVSVNRLYKLFAVNEGEEPNFVDFVRYLYGDLTINDGIGQFLDLEEPLASYKPLVNTLDVKINDILDAITGEERIEEFLMGIYGDLNVGDIAGELIRMILDDDDTYNEIVANDFIDRTFNRIWIEEFYNAIVDEDIDFEQYLMNIYGDMTIGGALDELLDSFVPEEILDNKAVKATLGITVQQIADLITGDKDAEEFARDTYGTLSINDVVGEYLGLEEPLASYKPLVNTLDITVNDIMDLATEKESVEEFLMDTYGDLTAGEIIGDALKMILDDDELYDDIASNPAVAETFKVTVKDVYDLANGDKDAEEFARDTYGALSIDQIVGEYLGLEEPLASYKPLVNTLDITVNDIMDLATEKETVEEFLMDTYGDLTAGEIVGDALKMILDDDELYNDIASNGFIDRTFNGIKVEELYNALTDENVDFADDYLMGIYGTMTVDEAIGDILRDVFEVPDEILDNALIAATLGISVQQIYDLATGKDEIDVIGFLFGETDPDSPNYDTDNGIYGGLKIYDIISTFIGDAMDTSMIENALGDMDVKDIYTMIVTGDETIYVYAALAAAGIVYYFLPEEIKQNELISRLVNIDSATVDDIMNGTLSDPVDIISRIYGDMYLGEVYTAFCDMFGLDADELLDQIPTARPYIDATLNKIRVSDVCSMINDDTFDTGEFLMTVYGDLTIDDAVGGLLRDVIGVDDEIMNNKALIATLGITVQQIYDLVTADEPDPIQFVKDVYGDLTLDECMGDFLEDDMRQNALIAATLGVKVGTLLDLATDDQFDYEEFIYDTYGELTLRQIYESVCELAGIDADEMLDELITGKPAIEKMLDHKVKEFWDEEIADMFDDVLIGDILDGLMSTIFEDLGDDIGFIYNVSYNATDNEYVAADDCSLKSLFNKIYNLNMKGIIEMIEDPDQMNDLIDEILRAIYLSEIADIFTTEWRGHPLFDKLFINKSVGDILDMVDGTTTVKDVYGDVSVGDILELFEEYIPDEILTNAAVVATKGITVGKVYDLVTADEPDFIAFLKDIYGDLTLGQCVEEFLGLDDELANNKAIRATFDDITVGKIIDLVTEDEPDYIAFVKDIYGDLTLDDCMGDFLEDDVRQNVLVATALGVKVGTLIDLATDDQFDYEEFIYDTYGELTLRQIYVSICELAELDADEMLDELITGKPAIDKMLDHKVKEFWDEEVADMFDDILVGDILDGLMSTIFEGLGDDVNFTYNVSYNSTDNEYVAADDCTLKGVFNKVYNLNIKGIIEMIEDPDQMNEFIDEILRVIYLSEIADIFTTEWRGHPLFDKLFINKSVGDILDMVDETKTVKDVYGDISVGDILELFEELIPDEIYTATVVEATKSITVGQVYDVITEDITIEELLMAIYGDYTIGELAGDLLKYALDDDELYNDIVLNEVVKRTFDIKVIDLYNTLTDENADVAEYFMGIYGTMTVRDIIGDLLEDALDDEILNNALVKATLDNITVRKVYDLATAEEPDVIKFLDDVYGTLSLGDIFGEFLDDDMKDYEPIKRALAVTVGDILDLVSEDEPDFVKFLLGTVGDDTDNGVYGDMTVGDVIGDMLPEELDENAFLNATKSITAKTIYAIATDENFDVDEFVHTTYDGVTVDGTLKGLVEIDDELRANAAIAATLNIELVDVYDLATAEEPDVVKFLKDTYGALTVGQCIEEFLELDDEIANNKAVRATFDNITVGKLIDLFTEEEPDYAAFAKDIYGDLTLGDCVEQFLELDDEIANNKAVRATFDDITVGKLIDLFTEEEPDYAAFAKDIYGDLTLGDCVEQFLELDDEIANNKAVRATFDNITVGKLIDLFTEEEPDYAAFAKDIYGDLTLGDCIEDMLDLDDELTNNKALRATFDNITVGKLIDLFTADEPDYVGFLKDIYGNLTLDDCIGQFLELEAPFDTNKAVEATLATKIAYIIDLATGDITTEEFLMVIYGELYVGEIVSDLIEYALDDDELYNKVIGNDFVDRTFNRIKVIELYNALTDENVDLAEYLLGIYGDMTVRGLLIEILEDSFEDDVLENKAVKATLDNITVQKVYDLVTADEPDYAAFAKDIYGDLTLGDCVEQFLELDDEIANNKAVRATFDNITVGKLIDLFTEEEPDYAAFAKDIYGDLTLGDCVEQFLELDDEIANNKAIRATFDNITVGKLIDLFTEEEPDYAAFAKEIYGDLTLGDCIEDMLDLDDDLTNNKAIRATFDNITVGKLIDLFTEEEPDYAAFAKDIYGDLTLGDCIEDMLDLDDELANNKAVRATFDNITVGKLIDLFTEEEPDYFGFVKDVYGDVTLGDVVLNSVLDDDMKAYEPIRRALAITVGDVVDLVNVPEGEEPDFMGFLFGANDSENGVYGTMTIDDVIGGLLRDNLDDNVMSNVAVAATLGISAKQLYKLFTETDADGNIDAVGFLLGQVDKNEPDYDTNNGVYGGLRVFDVISTFFSDDMDTDLIENALGDMIVKDIYIMVTDEDSDLLVYLVVAGLGIAYYFLPEEVKQNELITRIVGLDADTISKIASGEIGNEVDIFEAIYGDMLLGRIFTCVCDLAGLEPEQLLTDTFDAEGAYTIDYDDTIPEYSLTGKYSKAIEKVFNIDVTDVIDMAEDDQKLSDFLATIKLGDVLVDVMLDLAAGDDGFTHTVDTVDDPTDPVGYTYEAHGDYEIVLGKLYNLTVEELRGMIEDPEKLKDFLFDFKIGDLTYKVIKDIAANEQIAEYLTYSLDTTGGDYTATGDFAQLSDKILNKTIRYFADMAEDRSNVKLFLDELQVGDIFATLAVKVAGKVDQITYSYDYVAGKYVGDGTWIRFTDKVFNWSLLDAYHVVAYDDIRSEKLGEILVGDFAAVPFKLVAGKVGLNTEVNIPSDKYVVTGDFGVAVQKTFNLTMSELLTMMTDFEQFKDFLRSFKVGDVAAAILERAIGSAVEGFSISYDAENEVYSSNGDFGAIIGDVLNMTISEAKDTLTTDEGRKSLLNRPMGYYFKALIKDEGGLGSVFGPVTDNGDGTYTATGKRAALLNCLVNKKLFTFLDGFSDGGTDYLMGEEVFGNVYIGELFDLVPVDPANNLWKDLDGDDVEFEAGAKGMIKFIYRVKLKDISDFDFSSILDELTLRDVLDASIIDGNPLLEALADTAISGLSADTINDMTIGELMGYTLIKADYSSAANTYTYNETGTEYWFMDSDVDNVADEIMLLNELGTASYQDADDKYYYYAGNLMSVLADYTIGNLTGATPLISGKPFADDVIDKLGDNLTLGEVIDVSGNKFLKTLDNVKISQLADKINELYLGEIMGYYRLPAIKSVVPATSYTYDDSATPANYYWFEASDVDNVVGKVMLLNAAGSESYYDDQYYFEMTDKLMLILADKTVDDLTSGSFADDIMDDITSTMTLEDILPASAFTGNAVLNALKDTVIDDMADAINDMQIGKLLGYDQAPINATVYYPVTYTAWDPAYANSTYYYYFASEVKLITEEDDLTNADIEIGDTIYTTVDNGLEGVTLMKWQNGGADVDDQLMLVIADYTVKDMTEADFADSLMKRLCNSLTLRDVMGNSVDDNSVLKLIADKPIGKIADAMNDLSVGELMGYKNFTVSLDGNDNYYVDELGGTHRWFSESDVDHVAGKTMLVSAADSLTSYQDPETDKFYYYANDKLAQILSDYSVNELIGATSLPGGKSFTEDVIDKITESFTLGEVMGDALNGSTLLKSLEDVTIADLATEVQNMKIGKLMGYVELPVSDTYADRYDSTGLTSKWFSETDVIGDATLYTTDGSAKYTADGTKYYVEVDDAIMLLVANKTVAQLNGGDLADDIKALTIRQVLGDTAIAGNSILEALADTPISNLSTAINDMYLGEIMGYKRLTVNATYEDRYDALGATAKWFSETAVAGDATLYTSDGLAKYTADGTTYYVLNDDKLTNVIAGYKVSDIGGSFASTIMDRITSEFYLSDILGPAVVNSNPMLKAIDAYTIGNIAANIDNIKLGQVMGYYELKVNDTYDDRYDPMGTNSKWFSETTTVGNATLYTTDGSEKYTADGTHYYELVTNEIMLILVNKTVGGLADSGFAATLVNDIKDNVTVGTIFPETKTGAATGFMSLLDPDWTIGEMSDRVVETLTNDTKISKFIELGILGDTTDPASAFYVGTAPGATVENTTETNYATLDDLFVNAYAAGITNWSTTPNVRTYWLNLTMPDFMNGMINGMSDYVTNMTSYLTYVGIRSALSASTMDYTDTVYAYYRYNTSHASYAVSVNDYKTWCTANPMSAYATDYSTWIQANP